METGSGRVETGSGPWRRDRGHGRGSWRAGGSSWALSIGSRMRAALRRVRGDDRGAVETGDGSVETADPRVEMDDRRMETGAGAVETPPACVETAADSMETADRTVETAGSSVDAARPAWKRLGERSGRLADRSGQLVDGSSRRRRRGDEGGIRGERAGERGERARVDRRVPRAVTVRDVLSPHVLALAAVENDPPRAVAAEHEREPAARGDRAGERMVELHVGEQLGQLADLERTCRGRPHEQTRERGRGPAVRVGGARREPEDPRGMACRLVEPGVRGERRALGGRDGIVGLSSSLGTRASCTESSGCSAPFQSLGLRP